MITVFKMYSRCEANKFNNILSGFNIVYITSYLQLRKAQDDIIEIQTAHDHIQKRYEKLKSRRKEET